MNSLLNLANLQFIAYGLPTLLSNQALAKRGYFINDHLNVFGSTVWLLQHEENGEYIAVILGTNELSDWFVYNFRAYPPKEHDGRYYHRGFLFGGHLILDWIVNKTPALIVCHSLGGGLGQVVSAHSNIPVITFGAPKVLCWGNQFDSNCTNFMLENDPVVCEPRTIPFFNWRRVGVDKVLKSNKTQRYQHRMAHYIKALEDYPEDNM